MADQTKVHNPVGWFEIYVQDVARAQKFYETVLALQLTNLGPPDASMSSMVMRAFPMELHSGGASGALVKMDGVPSGGNSTIVYFISEDCAIEAGRVVAAGGRIFKEKLSIGQYGFIALAIDTEGNMFGVHSMK